MGRIFFIVGAVLMHLAFLLFGGLIVGTDKDDAGTMRTVDLLSGVEDEAKKKDEPEPEKPPAEDVVTDQEPIPENADVLETNELASLDSAPALEASSLAAIEAALNGSAGGAGGEFGLGGANLSASGGVIGGSGRGGGGPDGADAAFAMTEIDQKPRAVFQTEPLYPAEMRGKKVDGHVTFKFVVDADGKVTNALVESSSHVAFEKPALDALKQWKFEPGLRAGQRVASKMRVTIRFQPGK